MEAPAAETQSAEATAAEMPLADTRPAEIHLPPRTRWLTPWRIACIAVVLVLAGAFAVWRWRAVNPTSVDAKSTHVSNPSPKATSAVENLWMIAGSAAPYVDRSGRTWGPDRFFSGGNVLVRLRRFFEHWTPIFTGNCGVATFGTTFPCSQATTNCIFFSPRLV